MDETEEPVEPEMKEHKAEEEQTETSGQQEATEEEDEERDPPVFAGLNRFRVTRKVFQLFSQ